MTINGIRHYRADDTFEHEGVIYFTLAAAQENIVSSRTFKAKIAYGITYFAGTFTDVDNVLMFVPQRIRSIIGKLTKCKRLAMHILTYVFYL
jgi:hypothetical protein